MSTAHRAVLYCACSLLFLLSCSKDPVGTDADGDGVRLEDGDCDDNEAGVHAGADERCDGVDEDCDGAVDDDAVDRADFWPDRDGDGHGDLAANPVASCEQPPDTSPIDDDCDDADPDRYPGAPEACGSQVDDNCDGSPSDIDADDDGYASCEECDDRDPDINPEAEEYCNELDDDCDGVIDDDALDSTRYFLDLDGDGFGDPTTYTDECGDPPRGYVPDRSDCDDTRGTVGGPATWYRDQDGDTYGDPAAIKVSCDQPEGYVEVALDCDDHRDDFHPGAAEVAGSGIDLDCSGTYDCFVDDDADGYGDAVRASVDPLCGDPGLTPDGGDCDDADDEISPGATDVPSDLTDNDCDGFEVCFQDFDGDAHGSITALVLSIDLFCTGSGEAVTADDCNDSLATTYPGAADATNDGVDADCSGGETCRADADGDGHADEAGAVVESADLDCRDVGETTDTRADDCDDGDAETYTGAPEGVGNDIDEDCDGTLTCFLDEDGDGYGQDDPATWRDTTDADCTGFENAEVGDDCDDTSDDASPAIATESCDGLDNDCDGDADDADVDDIPGDALSYYADGDRDGYGDESASRIGVACEIVAGYSFDHTDCSDAEADVNPAADEVVANASDDDCNGKELCYQDVDGDAHGTTSTVVSDDTSCTNGGSEADVADDCDDKAKSTFPGATEAVGDNVDQDCDTHDLCGYDADADGFGSTTTIVSVGAYCVTGFNEALNTTDCNDGDAAYYPGASEVIADGLDQSCDGGDVCYNDADLDGHGTSSTSGAYTRASSDVDCADAYESAKNDDCDDSKSTVYNGAAEVLGDDVDQSCDGHDLCAYDADKDGYGHASTTLTSAAATCTGVNESKTRTDCNDLDAAYYPGAPEVVADGRDQSCDGVDTCYFDADGDTYGTATTVPSGDLDCVDAYESTKPTDCDDTRITIYPGATETVGDDVDQDCDTHDLCAYDGDGDTYGHLTTTAVAVGATCTGSHESKLRTDCNDGDASFYPGAAEVVADGKDQSCDGGDLCYYDADRDTYGTATTIPSDDLDCVDPYESSASDDCDDSKVTVYPGATETVGDDVDQDCDTHDLCAVDGDRDGYGHLSVTVVAAGAKCTGPNEAKTRTDCDDGEAAVYPGATEVVADGTDQDCNGGDSCYSDGDGDAWGTALVVLSGDLDCVDSGESKYKTDCDDATTSVYPGATETVGDDVDQDCDTHDKCGYDGDSDGYGHATTTALSVGATCTGSHESRSQTDCNDAASTVYPGATEVVADGVDQSCDTKELCYYDFDLDTWGTSTTTGSTDLDCVDSTESKYKTDCDDGKVSVYPGAAETLGDGVDQDCDTHDKCAYDGDSDGYGHGSTTATSVGATCTGAQESTNQDDCNDADAAFYPGAAEVIADGKDQSCDGGDTCYRDSDGDSYGTSSTSGTYTQDSFDLDCVDSGESASNTDCNDGASSVYVGATEVLGDGVDQNCDAHDKCAYDGDKDGYGHVTSTVTSAGATCSTASKEATNTTDCDDATSTTNPGASESCNFVDDDCDTVKDDGVDKYYYDADVDAHGTTSYACSSGSGYTAKNVSDDCDDADAERYPGMSELCDGKDNTCSSGWTAASDNGIITLTPSSGAKSNVSYSAPSSGTRALTLNSAGGTYNFCPGTYYVTATAGSSSGGVTLAGRGTGVYLDGAGAERVLVVSTGGATVKVQNLTLQNGKTTASGGIVSVTGSSAASKATVQFDGAKLSTGAASTNGGGMFVGAYGRAITGTAISGWTYALEVASGTAGAGGGVAVAANGEIDLNNAYVQSNSAAGGNGGGIYLAAASTGKLTNSTVYNNGATDGAGLYNAGTLTTITATFSTNTATDQGGGLYNAGSYTDTSSTFKSNTAVYGGGLAYEGGWSGLSGVTNRLYGTLVDTNTATDGAGLWVSTSAAVATTLLMTEPRIKGNKATGSGGGAYLGNKVAFECVSTDTVGDGFGLYYGFSANSASTGGGAYLAAGGAFKSTGCDFVEATGLQFNSPDDVYVVALASGVTRENDANFTLP